MAKCGKCHETGVTIQHVRACYGVPFANHSHQTVVNDTVHVTEHGQAGSAPVAVKTREVASFSDAHGNWIPRQQNPTGIPVRTPLDALRQEAKALLVRTERGALVGYFALRVDEVVKFYRLRSPQKGKWAGYLFVDAQGSQEFYPVRATTTLGDVLVGITADPEAAALLYSAELGRCSRCARLLTDETSREVGMGPECRSK